MRLLLLAAALAVARSRGLSTNHFFDQSIRNKGSVVKQGSWDCENNLGQCREMDKYPNIGQGFRGYNLVRGDPLATEGDPGYEAHIFDEETERGVPGRFQNTNGNDLNRCNGNVHADFLETSEDLFNSVIETEGDQSGFQVGPEMDISGSFGKEGAEVSASRHIPPIYQSLSSNSRVLLSTVSSINSEDRRVTRSRFECFEYEFSIKDVQHPKLAQPFESAVVALDSCLSSLTDYNSKTEIHDECARTFIRNFGTHYIKYAKFGSQISVITVLDKRVKEYSSSEDIEKCSTENSKWSFLGLFGGGDVSNSCKGSVFDNSSSSNRMVMDEVVRTVGSRPAADYIEWAKQMGKPEIIKKEVAPIGEILTTQFLTVLDKDRFDSDGVAIVKTLLDQFTVDYCGLFPSDCTFVWKRPYCKSQTENNKYESCECEPTSTNCGVYTGQINENFLPHGEGIMVVGGEVVRSIKWNNGVMEGEFIPPPAFEIPRDECRWKGAGEQNTLLRCDGNEIAVGVCSGGRLRDCGEYYHEIHCCAVPTFTSSKCELKNADRWGDPIDCTTTTNGNLLMTGACASSGTRDCHGQAQQAECCKGTLNNGAETLGVPDSSTCKWKYTDKWGGRLECDGNNSAVVGHCGSGNMKDCPDSMVHGILCCEVDVI